jgi:hypothetical protein
MVGTFVVHMSSKNIPDKGLHLTAWHPLLEIVPQRRCLSVEQGLLTWQRGKLKIIPLKKSIDYGLDYTYIRIRDRCAWRKAP